MWVAVVVPEEEFSQAVIAISVDDSTTNSISVVLVFRVPLSVITTTMKSSHTITA